MKFRALHVIALCICLVQICSAANEYTEGRINQIKEDIQNKVHDASERFVEDITTILDHTPSNPYFIEIIHGALVITLSDISQKHNNTKFYAKHLYSTNNENRVTNHSYHTIIQKLDYYKILQSTLSKQFPPERYNGIINMFYVNLYPNATSEEITNVLNYLDGTDNAATKISYLDSHNFPDPVASDCPDRIQEHSEAVDELKSMSDIKSKVFQDFASIEEKFPCNAYTDVLPGGLVQAIKIDKCKILKKSDGIQRIYDEFEYTSTMMESILSLRLPDETFRDLLNVIKVLSADKSKDEIEKAFEYLYDDVHSKLPDCSSESKAQN